MQSHPLLPPLIAPGAWPGATPEDKANELMKLKQQRIMTAGFESCLVKGIISGAVGAYIAMSSVGG